MRKSKWRLTDKKVLITGAANGIGAATARILAKRKTHLSLIDVQGFALRQLALDLGVGAICHEVDITKRVALDEAVASTLDRFDRIDVVLVNVGVVTVGSVERGDPHAFERVITVNLLGAWQTVRTVLPHVIASQGYILFVSSIAGTVQGPLNTVQIRKKSGGKDKRRSRWHHSHHIPEEERKRLDVPYHTRNSLGWQGLPVL